MQRVVLFIAFRIIANVGSGKKPCVVNRRQVYCKRLKKGI